RAAEVRAAALGGRPRGGPGPAPWGGPDPAGRPARPFADQRAPPDPAGPAARRANPERGGRWASPALRRTAVARASRRSPSRSSSPAALGPARPPWWAR